MTERTNPTRAVERARAELAQAERRRDEAAQLLLAELAEQHAAVTEAQKRADEMRELRVQTLRRGHELGLSASRMGPAAGVSHSYVSRVLRLAEAGKPSKVAA